MTSCSSSPPISCQFPHPFRYESRPGRYVRRLYAAHENNLGYVAHQAGPMCRASSGARQRRPSCGGPSSASLPRSPEKVPQTAPFCSPRLCKSGGDTFSPPLFDCAAYATGFLPSLAFPLSRVLRVVRSSAARSAIAVGLRSARAVPVAVVSGVLLARRPCVSPFVLPGSAGRAAAAAHPAACPYRTSPFPVPGGHRQSWGITPLRLLGGRYRLPSRSRIPAGATVSGACSRRQSHGDIYQRATGRCSCSISCFPDLISAITMQDLCCSGRCPQFRWVGPGRPAGIAPGGFPRPARQTRRATLTAPGSPRALAAGLAAGGGCRWLGCPRGGDAAFRGSGSG